MLTADAGRVKVKEVLLREILYSFLIVIKIIIFNK